MTNQAVAVGARLRERRQAFGYDIKQLAHMIGRSYSYIRQLERGINAPPTWPLLVDLARVLNTSTDYLLGVVDDPVPANRRDLPPHAGEVLEMMRNMSEQACSQVPRVLEVLRAIDDPAPVELNDLPPYAFQVLEIMRGMSDQACRQAPRALEALRAIDEKQKQ